MRIDIERFRRGAEQIDVVGPIMAGRIAHPVRHEAIEDAIKAIQDDPAGALGRSYIGVKNYAGFGDQRSDHDVGMIPNHGHIVFRIQRFNGRQGRFDDDAIYALEVVRDAGTRVLERPSGGTYDANAIEMLRRHDRLTEEARGLLNHLKCANVEPNV